MPQKFVAMFKKLGNQRKRRQNFQPEASSSSDSDDVDLYSNDVLSMVTRNGPLILKRHEAFDNLFKNGVSTPLNKFDCIMACGNTRNTILYPCRHIHLCRECWFLLKTYELKQCRYISFENDSDDNVMKPRCPYCRNGVESSDEVYL